MFEVARHGCASAGAFREVDRYEGLECGSTGKFVFSFIKIDMYARGISNAAHKLYNKCKVSSNY